MYQVVLFLSISFSISFSNHVESTLKKEGKEKKKKLYEKEKRAVGLWEKKVSFQLRECVIKDTEKFCSTFRVRL